MLPSLEEKFYITNPLTQLPDNSRKIEQWLESEFNSPRSQTDTDTPRHSTSVNGNDCTILREEINNATLDPARRCLGYLFAKCGRSDEEAASWINERFSVDNLFILSVGFAGGQNLLYQKMRIGLAQYAWPDLPRITSIFEKHRIASDSQRKNPEKSPKSALPQMEEKNIFIYLIYLMRFFKRLLGLPYKRNLQAIMLWKLQSILPHLL